MSAYTGGIERLEAILAEAGQRMQYPPTPDFAPAVLERVEVARARPARRLPRLWPMTPRARLVLIVVLALLLLACAAGITYVVTQTTWLRSAPRGVHFTDDFSLVELFRDDDPRTHYQELVIGPEGKEIYAVRWLGEEEAELFDPQEMAVVRMSGLQDERVQIDVALKFDDLRDPALWDPDMDLTGIILPGHGFGLSAASNGDLFLVADAWAGTAEFPFGALRPEGPPAGKSLIVRHPDGTVQKVLTVRELVEAGLLGAEALERSFTPVDAAPASSGRLWLQVITLEPLEDPPPYSLVRRYVYEVRDPNADGDWSDRTVTPITLPSSLAEQRRDSCCRFQTLVAEPSAGREDRSDSFLLTHRTPYPEDEHRVYRVSDVNGDGDLLDGGEFELIFAGVPPGLESRIGPGEVTPRLVIQDKKVVLRELIIDGFTTETRVSRITESGDVIDIARAFSSILDVLADSEGNIYVWAFPPDGSSARVLYKLKPVLAK